MKASRKIRVGVDMHVVDGKYQGSRSYLIGLYSELISQCPDIQFVFLLDRVDILASMAEFNRPNVVFHRMQKANSIWRIFIQLPLLQLRLGLDLLHTQYIAPPLPRKGHVVTIHDVLFEEYPQFFSKFFVLRSRWLMRRAAQRADILLTVSEYSRRQISRCYGRRESDISVTLNAADIGKYHPGQDGSETLAKRGLVSGAYILTVGRIEPRKNHATLLRAWKKLPGTPPPLVIVGQRDFGFSEFDAEVQEIPPDRELFILSDVDDKELPILYRHAMLFVYPSLAEGFGMPPLEAMASGVAVLSSSTTAIPEVLGNAGVVVDPRDADALSAALAGLIAEPERRAALAAAGLARAQAFSWKSSAAILGGCLRAWFRRREAR